MNGTRTTKSTVAGALITASLLAAGCGSVGGGEAAPPPPPAPSPLVSFDPCTALDSSELQQYGIKPPGRTVDQGVGEPGCQFRGDPYFLVIYKTENEGLDYWQGQRNNFVTFEPNKVGDRPGIKAITKGSEGHGVCRQIIGVGPGTVSTEVQYQADKSAGTDPCSEALKIAQQIEPELPK